MGGEIQTKISTGGSSPVTEDTPTRLSVKERDELMVSHSPSLGAQSPPQAGAGAQQMPGGAENNIGIFKQKVK